MVKILAGIDFGSDSVRVLLCEAYSGKQLASGSSNYTRWSEGKFCDPEKNKYRQHALDYLEGLVAAFEEAKSEILHLSNVEIVGIAIDTTGSTPAPVNEDGIPLCLLPEFTNNPNAMFHLWKDHTAVHEAKLINEIFSGGSVDYTKYQGVYSSEWFWAKILHTTQVDPTIHAAAYMWIEHCDWIAGVLADNIHPDTIKKSACAAGHKALWNSEFNGLPARNVLQEIDPYLGLIYDRYRSNVVPAGTPMGTISEHWATELGVSQKAIIGMGSLDAHAGGVGAGIQERVMVKVIGTSTVDLVIEHFENTRGKDLRNICGQAENSIIPGYMGLEMGQPAFGDAYSWLRSLTMWAIQEMEIPAEVLPSEKRYELSSFLHSEFIRQIEKEAPAFIQSDELALDWLNGRRYPVLNETVKSMFAQINLATTLPAIFCALVKGTVFGSRRIFESLKKNGIEIDHIIAVGGIAEKSPFIMQMLADALKTQIIVHSDTDVCARGAAMYAAVACGIFSSLPEAQKAYNTTNGTSYYPDVKMFAIYDQQYEQYLKLGEMSEVF